jgi:hypothetical protein
MPLPCPGPEPIGLSNIQSEFGGSNPIGLGEYYRNGAYVGSNNTNVPTSGSIKLSDFFCAVNEIVVYITSTTTNVNVQTLFEAIYPGSWAQNTPKKLIINSGVVVGSPYTSQYALTVPSGASSTVTIDNYGSIQGAGGFPDIIRASFSASKDSSVFNRIIFNGPNAFSYDDGRLSGDDLVYTNTNYAMSCQTDQCGCSLRILASNAIGVDDSQGCSPDGDYNDLIVYVSVGYFFESGGTIYYRIDGNSPTGGNAILASSAVRINNQGTIYAGGGAGGRGGDGGQGVYDCSYIQILGATGAPGISGCNEVCQYWFQNGNAFCNSGCEGYFIGDEASIQYNTCSECGVWVYQNCYSGGGAGSGGGLGQGFNQNLTGGSPGFPGGINAGTGGTGGTGGNWGASGDTGFPGFNGNYTVGGVGLSGGSGGYYIVNNGNVTWINLGAVLGGVG